MFYLNKENSINFTDSNEAQFRILATKFNEAVEVILELSDKVSKLEKVVYKTHSQNKKENSVFNYINIKMLFIFEMSLLIRNLLQTYISQFFNQH